MNLVNGSTYRFLCRADSRRSLNVYAAAGAAPSLANVCLWGTDPDDACQQWVYKESGSKRYLACKNNPGVALDLFTGSSASGNISNFNAHVYTPSSTSYITFLDTDSGYVMVRLSAYSDKYLTANQGSNGSGSGKDVNAPGNVYWYKGGLADHSQEWKPVESGVVGGDLKDNYLTYPVEVMKISQTYNDGNHYGYSHGAPHDYPIDDPGLNQGRAWFYCPCDEMKVTRVYGVGNGGVNTIWLESTSPVLTPSGEFYITIMVMHPEDADLSGIANRVFTRGDAMFREGMDGPESTGNHFHISVGMGITAGNGWTNNDKKCWVLTTTDGTIKPEQAFYVDSDFTTVTDAKGLNFRTLPSDVKTHSLSKTC